MTGRARCALVLVAVACSQATPLVAQTVDRARLIVGLALGRIGGTDLWVVDRQAIPSSFQHVADTFELHRAVRPGLTVSGHVTYFASPHFGFTGELTYLGLGNESSCALRFDDGDASLVRACDALSDHVVAASSVSFQVGAIARVLPGSVIQPYVAALAGFASTPSSTIETIATYIARDGREAQMAVYHDFHWSSQRPTWTLGGGVVTAPSQGLQVRLELRETWLQQSEVTASNPVPNLEPPSRSVLKGFPSILLGVEFVFRRERGRRY